MSRKNIFRLIFSIVIAQLAGVIGSFFTLSAITIWYADLIKPALNPPNWIFGPVWTTLYTLMGVAMYLVWKHGRRNHKVQSALHFYGTQLILNALWSIIFFGLKNPGLALFEIIVLLIFITITMIKFYSISKLALYLMIPYLLWVGFATYLNYAIWMLN